MSDKTPDLEAKMASMSMQPYAVALGRAAWGIALTLRCIGERLCKEKSGTRPRIAMPAFLCQSPLGAVLSEDWEPLFCDIDLQTGIIPIREWERVFRSGVDAALLVHMFGNPDENIQGIAALCAKHQVFLMEDACLALGATAGGRPCGAWGDAAFYSFGHTKLIDVGSGGILVTRHGWLASDVRNQLKTCEPTSDEVRNRTAETFLKKFYDAKSHLIDNEPLAKKKFSGLIGEYYPLVSQKWDLSLAEKILPHLDNLPSIVELRRNKANQYRQALVPFIEVLGMSGNSVPWRFVFRIAGISRNQQERLSECIREEGVHVSNWYLPLHWILPSGSEHAADLRQTEMLSREIFQFWLNESADSATISRNCEIFSSCLNKLMI